MCVDTVIMPVSPASLQRQAIAVKPPRVPHICKGHLLNGPAEHCVLVNYDANMTPLSLTDALVCRQLDEVMDGTWKGMFNGEYI